MLLFDRDNWKSHRSWFAFVALATLSAVLWYAVASFAASRWLGGGSLPGFSFGVIGGILCLFELLLWPRKKLRRLRLGRTKTWMKAHIWLGLLSLPILILHSGFVFGGMLSKVLMIVLIVVIASGIWGLLLQNLLPKKMLEEVKAETIDSQIDRIIGHYHDEATQLVHAICGQPPIPATAGDPDEGVGVREESTHYLVIGAIRQEGKISGKVLATRVVTKAVPGSEPLRAFFEAVASPFLKPAGYAASPLRQADRAATIFADLKTRLATEAHEAVDSLRSLCDQRRELAAQHRMHVWLHIWLVVHLPLSVALIALMFVHIFAALKYL